MAKILKWPDHKTALGEAVDFEKEIGFDGVIVIGRVKDKPGEIYVGLSDGIEDPYIVYLLECAKQRVCLETLMGSDTDEG